VHVSNHSEFDEITTAATVIL